MDSDGQFRTDREDMYDDTIQYSCCCDKALEQSYLRREWSLWDHGLQYISLQKEGVSEG